MGLIISSKLSSLAKAPLVGNVTRAKKSCSAVFIKCNLNDCELITFYQIFHLNGFCVVSALTKTCTSFNVFVSSLGSKRSFAAKQHLLSIKSFTAHCCRSRQVRMLQCNFSKADIGFNYPISAPDFGNADKLPISIWPISQLTTHLIVTKADLGTKEKLLIRATYTLKDCKYVVSIKLEIYHFLVSGFS